MPRRGDCRPQNPAVLLQESGRCKPACPRLPSTTRALLLEGWLRPGALEAGHRTRLPVRGALGTSDKSPTLSGSG